MADIRLYIAHLTGGQGPMLECCRFDPRDGSLTSIWAGGEGIENPLFLQHDAAGRFMFVADLVNEYEGKPGAPIAAFRIDRATGALTYINRQFAGEIPCYLSVARDGRFVLAANYRNGAVTVLPISDGTLGAVCARYEHGGGDLKANAHCVIFDAGERHALAADLGVNRVFIYRFDEGSGKLTPADPPHVQAAEKSGPRHLALHPGGRFLYCQTEYDNTVMAMSYNAETGKAAIIQTLSSLPAGYGETTYGADIAVHPSGRWLYSTNRGHDSLAMYSIDAASGKLTSLGYQPTGGQFPRSFAIDPTGAFLLVGNERSDRINVFRIDGDTGRLTDAGPPLSTPKPACLRFITL